MPETSMQSESLPVLLPGSVKRLTTLAESKPVPLQSELHRFLDLVICDGRYLNEVENDPTMVANQLGFELSADTEAEFRAKPLQHHVAGLYAERFQGAIGQIAIIVIAAIIIIIAIAIVRYSRKSEALVRDLSPHARLKL